MHSMEPLICQKCGAVLRGDPEGGARCEHCGTVYAEPHTLCPRCGYKNEEEAGYCGQCGTALAVRCPACGRSNWAGAEHCDACGRDFDALQHAFRSFQQSFQLHREETRAGLRSLRRKEEGDSQERMEALLEIDRRRLLAEAKDRARAKFRERIIMIVMSAAVVVFLFLLVIVFALGWL